MESDIVRAFCRIRQSRISKRRHEHDLDIIFNNKSENYSNQSRWRIFLCIFRYYLPKCEDLVNALAAQPDAKYQYGGGALHVPVKTTIPNVVESYF